MPTPLRIVAILLSTVAGLSAVAFALGAAFTRPAPVWSMIGFELVAMLAGWFAFRASWREQAEGRALTLLCAAGCTAVGAYLGSLAAAGQVMEIGLKPFVLGRIGLGAGLAALAAVEVLRHEPGPAFRRLLLAALLLAPAAVLGFCVYRGVGLGWFAAMTAPSRIATMIGGGVVVGGLFCAGVHLIIRAFQSALTKSGCGVVEISTSQAPSTPPG
ncbi:MAG: hypothetical protein ACT4PL_06135 [Phycisphaerales bacterium]